MQGVIVPSPPKRRLIPSLDESDIASVEKDAQKRIVIDFCNQKEDAGPELIDQLFNGQQNRNRNRRPILMVDLAMTVRPCGDHRPKSVPFADLKNFGIAVAQWTQ